MILKARNVLDVLDVLDVMDVMEEMDVYVLFFFFWSWIYCLKRELRVSCKL